MKEEGREVRRQSEGWGEKTSSKLMITLFLMQK